MANFETLRQELRGLDGDLYLCHLFAPSEKRDALLTLYHFYADIARIPSTVSDPMIGAIRLQWWRDLLDAVEAGDSRGTPIGEALLHCGAVATRMRPLIDGREAALAKTSRTLEELQEEAEAIGPHFMYLAAEIMGRTENRILLSQAGTGFELMRLVPSGGDDVARRAAILLTDACLTFNRLPRKQRKALLPIFLPIGLARRQAAYFPREKGLLHFQLSLLGMALRGKL